MPGRKGSRIRFHSRLYPAKIDSPAFRKTLPRRRAPFFLRLSADVALGYRRSRAAGYWVVRVRAQKHATGGLYYFKTIGIADDIEPADGAAVLSFDQARTRGIEWYMSYRDYGRRPADTTRRACQMPDPPDAPPYTVSHAARDYFQWLLINRRNTRSHLSKFHVYIEPAFGSRPLTDLTATEIWTWFEGIVRTAPRIPTILAAEWSARPRYPGPPKDDEALRRRRTTANSVLGTLRAMLNHAYARGLVESDSAWKRIPCFNRGLLPPGRALTIEECRALLATCPTDLRALAQAALLTGCRLGELRLLRVQDFIPSSGRVYIAKSKTGKGRSVSLTAEGRRFFAAAARGRPPEELLFLRRDGTMWPLQGTYNRLQTAAQRAEIDGTVHFRLFRHTYASHAVMAGIPLTVVAAQLGHVDTLTVMRNYAHLAESYVDEVVRSKMPDLV